MDDGEAWPGRYRPCGAESDGCRAGRAPGSDATAINHFCLECDDLDATAAGLRSAGIQLTVEPMGSTIIVKAGIEYPDGNRIEFMQMSPKSMQAEAIGRMRGG